MGSLEDIKQKILDNDKIIEQLILKKQQEAQINLLNEEKQKNEKDTENNPKYITKVIAAQEIITYLFKLKMPLFVCAGASFIAIFSAFLFPVGALFLSMVISVFALIGIKTINDNQKYLSIKYKLPGYERYEKKPIQDDNKKKEFSKKLNQFFTT